MRVSSHLLTHSSHSCNGWGKVRSKPEKSGAQSKSPTWILGTKPQELPPRIHIKRKLGAEPGCEPGTIIRRTGVPTVTLSLCQVPSNQQFARALPLEKHFYRSLILRPLIFGNKIKTWSSGELRNVSKATQQLISFWTQGLCTSDPEYHTHTPARKTFLYLFHLSLNIRQHWICITGSQEDGRKDIDEF